MKRRLEKLEASITAPGDGSEDLCPKCGGLTLEMLMWEAEARDGDDQSEEGDQPSEETDQHTANARCRRCGAPTLLAELTAFMLDHQL